MVIVFVVDNFSSKTDGTNISAQRFREQLINLGHEVRVLALGVEGEGMFGLKEHYIPIVTPVAKKSNMRFAKFDKQIVKRALDGADVVHLFFPFKLQRKTYKLSKKMGIPVTAAFHCQPENISYNIGLKKFGFVNKILYKMFKSWLYKRVDSIHCPSKFLANELEKNKYKAKLHIISNGVSDSFVPTATEVIRDDNMINILMVGRLAAEKRQDLIIKAVGMSKYKERIQIYFAGKGPKEKSYKKLGNSLPNKPIFQFLSQIELIDRLHKTDIYIHASDIEIEGISCIEAISTGAVAIISNSKKSATPQFALSDKSLFNAGDAKDLKEKMDYLIEHEGERKQLSFDYANRGRQYSVAHSAKLFESFIKEGIADEKIKNAIKENKALKKYRSKTRAKKNFKNGIKVAFYYCFAAPMLLLINKLFFGLKIEGRKNIKKAKKTGAITICNHIHNLDSSICALGLFPKRPIFTTLPSNLNPSLIGYLVRMLGGVPTPNSVDETKTFIYNLSKSARARRMVHVFPEGELIKYDDKLREFKKGAFYLAVDSKKPIVPMRINYRKPVGLYKLFKRHSPCITLKIGEPVYHDFLLERQKAVVDLQKRSEEKMSELVIEKNINDLQK